MIDEAVVLMAGAGSRLRAGGHELPKPLVPLFGRPLVSYTLDMLSGAGIKTVHLVVGFEREVLMSQVERLAPSGITVRFIENRDWQKQNGISVLAAAEHVRAPFLLTMADHLFDQAIVDLMVRAPAAEGINLAIDRKLDAIFDLADAMKVRTRGDRLVAIGKDLPDYDAIDTGMFVCAENVFDYLESAKRNGDCSLADGVRAAAEAGQVWVTDIGDAWWQDVDTPEMLIAAHERLRSQSQHGGTAENAARARDPEPQM